MPGISWRAKAYRTGLLVPCATALLLAQNNPVADGIAAFHRGDYKAARGNLERASGDPQARLFLALIKAATGECESALPELSKGFASGENRRLAGLALAQCHLTARPNATSPPNASPKPARLSLSWKDCFPGMRTFSTYRPITT
ncbi:exported hypothetical protein [Candidatus Sulfopaludibacter sp. SbA3]|nr:exported hypothetical protein [Candidatus Sulfopaludibacter sp. SbA3]